jgi:hypothetical protein
MPPAYKVFFRKAAEAYVGSMQNGAGFHRSMKTLELSE